MELIPVLDLARGVAVHAVGGDRSRYEPVRSVLVPGCEGDALALARAYRGIPHVTRCYVADLDAIAGEAPQHELLSLLRSPDGFDGPLLLDAGVATPAGLDDLGSVTGLVVGLETLRSFADLEDLAARTSVTFSLDLRHDAPIMRQQLRSEAGTSDPVALGRAAIDAGAESLILLDVARVGRGMGVNLALLGSLRRQLSGVQLLVGGGVGGEEDIRTLADAGCDGALIATALHNGAVTARRAGPRQPGVSDVR